jgi:hypothetical protein
MSCPIERMSTWPLKSSRTFPRPENHSSSSASSNVVPALSSAAQREQVRFIPHLGDSEFIPNTGYSSDIHRLAIKGWFLCSRKTSTQKPKHRFVGSIK